MEKIESGRYGSDIKGAAVRTMTLFYLFDTSGSMSGTKIGQVNYAMRDVPKIIKEIADGAPNADIEVAAATFDTEVTWITPEPQSPDEFINTWHDVQAGGLTSVGAALNSLNQKMSRSGFLKDNPSGYLAPGVIILSDGEPTDSWQSALEAIKKNNWFKQAIKVAFAVGDDANKQVLGDICGSSEAVVSIDDPQKIRSYIKFVTATVSKTGTTSQTELNKTKQEAVNENLQSLNDDNNQTFAVDIPAVDDSQW